MPVDLAGPSPITGGSWAVPGTDSDQATWRFEPKRGWIAPGTAACPFRLGSSALGITVCEDAWGPGEPWTDYAAHKVAVIPNINASPYHRRKVHERLDVCRDRVRETGAWIVYVNAVGGQDELVFDGGSMVVSPQGELAWHGAMFEEDLLVVDIPASGAAGELGPSVDVVATKPPLPDPSRPAWPGEPEEVYRALVLGLGDYVRNNGFRDVVLGGLARLGLRPVHAELSLAVLSVAGLATPANHPALRVAQRRRGHRAGDAKLCGRAAGSHRQR